MTFMDTQGHCNCCC